VKRRRQLKKWSGVAVSVVLGVSVWAWSVTALTWYVGLLTALAILAALAEDNKPPPWGR
jgi:hypothetical protein